MNKDNNIETYISQHITSILEKITNDINGNTVDEIVQKNLKYHSINNNSSSFQKYYFETLENKTRFLSSKTFFHEFKRRYSLQGLDKTYLDYLEENKNIILTFLEEDKLLEIYTKYFAKANIKYGEKRIDKDLGSFFAKLVHTFKPYDYCALDNPIKNYFGLKRESFFIAFSIISSAYKLWSINNGGLLASIRQDFKTIDKNTVIKHDRVTDLKLLDLIYWSKADAQLKNKKAISTNGKPT